MTFIIHRFRVSVVSDVRERVRDFRITFALYVKKIFINKGTTAQLNETRFGPKKNRPQYISAQKISTLFDAGWAWNCQIIFRCASIHGRAGFILCELKRALYGIKCNFTLIQHQKVSRFFGPRYIGDDFF
jgi:hypothetical protein